MALLDLLRDALEGHLESKRVQLLGPDYRQKQAESAARVGLLGAQTRGAEADVLGTEARTRQTGVQTSQMEQAGKDIEEQKAELRRLAETGALPSAYLPIVQTMLEKQTGESQGSLRDAQRQQALAGIPTREERLAELEGTRATADLRRAQAEEARRAPKAGAGAGGYKWVTDKSGNERLVSSLEIALSPPGTYKQAPTAEMRNQERYDLMIPAMLDEIDRSLEPLEQMGWMGGAKSLVPGSKERIQKALYSNAVQALAATVGRTYGDTRITDADRPVYARMLGVANQLAAFPPGSREARALINRMKRLQGELSSARRRSTLPTDAREGAVSGEEVVTDLPGGGWDQGAADALSDRPVPRRGLRVLSVEEIE